MVMAVDRSGICLAGATIEVIGGQRIGTIMTQPGACDAWWFAEIEFTGLTPGVEMTLRVSAPGYSPQVVTVIPTSGPQTALVLELLPNGRRSSPEGQAPPALDARAAADVAGSLMGRNRHRDSPSAAH
jgi:hypothetical protein